LAGVGPSTAAVVEAECMNGGMAGSGGATKRAVRYSGRVGVLVS
jgi:hypothetical protein